MRETWNLPSPAGGVYTTGRPVTNGSGHEEEARCSGVSIHPSIWMSLKEAGWMYNMVLSDLYPKGWK